ncbi:TonB-dependent receptor [Parapedobacter sp. DT-150]|uniref:TonB-dependent receptor n=1 Tax=Parapedobacter sp. DT-150 TaxID=3396162 RepID=UPI003F1CD74B
MKLVHIMLLLSAMHVSARMVAQPVTLSEQHIPIGKLFEKVREQTGYDFFYDSRLLRSVKPLSVNFRNTSLEEVMKTCLAGTNLTFSIADRAVVIKATFPGTQGESASSIQQTITGTVRDEEGHPLSGATVRLKGTSTLTVTDADGRYRLSNVGDDATISVSFTGFLEQDLAIAGRNTIDIVLRHQIIEMDDVVVVGYGTQRKADVTGAIAAVEGSELARAPVATVSGTLGGRVAGVIARNNSGRPGADASTVRIRGISTTGNAAPLVLVDGIPMDYNLVNVDDIENLTVLKDAAAVAPYGLAGANGVILVTTKRGKEGRFSFTYNGYYGVQTPTAVPDYLDAYQYATTQNLANANVGNPEPYSEDVLERYRSGSDPDRYPDTDWAGRLIERHTPMTKHTLSFTGGSDKIRFFGSGGYLGQEGVASTITFKRYNVTTNVDADVTKTTKFLIDFNAAATNENAPAAISPDGIFNYAKETPPINPMEFSNGLPAHSILPAIYESGYNRQRDYLLNFRSEIAQTVPFLPGLTLRGVFAYRKGFDTNKTWSLPLTFYGLDSENNFTEQRAGPNLPTLNQEVDEYHAQTIQLYATYKKVIGQHGIDGLVVYENRTGRDASLMAGRINYVVRLDEISQGSSNRADYNNSGSSAKWAQEGWVYRLNYAFKDRYLLGVSGRYDGHYYFAPGKRYAFFPAVSVGWRLSEENFLHERVDWLNELKIRASHGKSGNLAGSAFQYLTAYGLRSGYVFGGASPTQVQGIYEQAQANPNITWETAIKTDVGVDATFLGNRLTAAFDVFYERRSGMLLNPTTAVPAEYGIGISQINAGEMKNRGLEFSLDFKHQTRGGFTVNLGGNFSYASNELVQTFETAATYNSPNRRRTGMPWNTRFGLAAEGLYQVDDFDGEGNLLPGLPVPTYGKVYPGDIRYHDVNGDSVINISDETAIGKPQFPEIIFGLNTHFAWKGFDLNALFQGAGNTSLLLEGELAHPFYNGATMAVYQLDYWTPANPDAPFPRLTPAPVTNNQEISSFWIRNGTYLRLKTLELGYSIPPSALAKLSIRQARIALSGQNLLTFSAFKQVDPELSQNRARYYFQQKVYTVGITLGF